MADFSKIIDHPDKQDIIDRLVGGATPKEVSTHLKLKYPDKEQAHLRLTATLLQSFLDTYLDVNEDFKKDLTALKKQDEEYRKNLSPALANSASYKQRIEEIADTELDIIQFAKEILLTAKARLEQVFDKIQEDPTKINSKQEYVVIKWYEVVSQLIEKYQKVTDTGSDQITNYNITMQMVDDQVYAIQEATRRSMLKMSPDEANKFIDIFNYELTQLKPPKPEEAQTQEERMADVKLLEEKVEKVKNDEDDDE